MFYLVTKELITCREKALVFEKNSIYSEVMCGKQLKLGTTDARYFAAREKNFLLGMTKEDDQHFEDFHRTDCRMRCCLPKGHPGPCQGTLEKYYKDKIANKVKDAHQAPGGDDVVENNYVGDYNCNNDDSKIMSVVMMMIVMAYHKNRDDDDEAFILHN
jgi:hypothetical protein